MRSHGAESRKQGISVSDVEIRALSCLPASRRPQFSASKRYRPILQFQNPPLPTKDFEAACAARSDESCAPPSPVDSVTDSGCRREFRSATRRSSSRSCRSRPAAFKAFTVTDAELTAVLRKSERHISHPKAQDQVRRVDVDQVRPDDHGAPKPRSPPFNQRTCAISNARAVRASHLLFKLEAG